MKSILLTGGIGDVIAVESLMTDEERQSINGIYYATSKVDQCIQLFDQLPTFPNLKKQSIIWRDFSKFFCFHNKEQLRRLLSARQPIEVQQTVEKLMASIDDYSIEKIFREQRAYTYSSFVNFKLADIDKFTLPTNYYFVCPYSTDKRDIRRDYNHIDWSQTLTLLKEKGMFGVVASIGEELIPQDETIINLNNKTNIRESIEILKKAKGYIGIDSCFTVIAPKVLQPENIIIKSLNNHCYKWKHIYYAPQNSFEFLRERII